MGNSKLIRAYTKGNINNEFYTRYETVEEQVEPFLEHFKNKVIYLISDNPYYSQYFRYFIDNFNELGIKALLSTNLSIDDDTLENNEDYQCIIRYVPDDVPSDINDLFKYEKNTLEILEKGEGCLYSDNTSSLMKEVDIIVTNPPFSKYGDLIEHLMYFKVDFILLGNMNSVSNSGVAPYILNDEINVSNFNSVNVTFDVPMGYSGTTKMGNICTYTTFEVPFNDKHTLELETNYYGNEHKYQILDNYNILCVDRIKEIPKDYNYPMAVPLTIFKYINQIDYRIIGICQSSTIEYNKPYVRPLIDYGRVVQYKDGEDSGLVKNMNYDAVIYHDEKPKEGTYYVSPNYDGYYTVKYTRVIIQKRTDWWVGMKG